MSHVGAKVIYPPTIQPVLSENIPIYIKNTFEPLARGTLIHDQVDPESPSVKGISSIPHIALLTLQGSGLFGVPGTAARVFGALAKGGINVILITQGSSEHSISFAIDPEFSSSAKKLVDAAFELEISKGVVDKVIVEDGLSVIAVIGENMRYRPGISGRLFQALGRNGINVVAIAQGSSELNISVVAPREDEKKALNALHEAFFLSDIKRLNVFFVGVGLIGGTLLEQIKKQVNKIINVIKVADLTDQEFVERELVLLKVNAKPENRAEILRITDIFRGQIVDVGQEHFTINITGDADKITAILTLLKPFGIREIARTGSIAMFRENKSK